MSDWGDIETEIEASITREQAWAVREMRVDDGLTWRGVSDSFSGRFGEALYEIALAGNQIVGMLLCRAAAVELGEDPDADPWN